MDVPGKTSGKPSTVKRFALVVILIAAAIFGFRVLLPLAPIGQEQPTREVAAAKIQREIFPRGVTCFGFDPPCATPQYTYVSPRHEIGSPAWEAQPEWCVTLIYLHQRQSDVDAVEAAKPDWLEMGDLTDELQNLPYYQAELQGYCGEFRSYSFNGRNNENDVNGWAWPGPIREIKDDIRATVKGS